MAFMLTACAVEACGEPEELPANNVCANMRPVCTADGLKFPAGVNSGSAESGNNYQCLSTTPNPAWYYLQIDQAGGIVMALSSTSDIDFALWGPYDNIAAAIAACGSLPAPKDCSYSPAAVETPEVPGGAQTGKVFVLLLTNYANVEQEVSIERTGGPGTTSCDVLRKTLKRRESKAQRCPSTVVVRMLARHA